MTALNSVGVLIMCQAMSGLGDMFDAKTYDFGAVPRGSITTHRFTLKNTLDQDIVASNVSSSCKCATPSLEKAVAKPGEEIVVAVKYNTETFTGPRSMTIYVNFTQPRVETATLRVSGVSRADVVFNPAEANLGTVSRGQPASRTVRVDYAGGMDWRIEDIQSSANVQAKAVEANRGTGRVSYQIEVTLLPSAPAGLISEAIELKTNDPQSPTLRLGVTANVEAPLVASPSALQLGSMKPGETAVRRVLLQGKQPFTIKAVGGRTDSMKVLCTEGPRKVHILQIEYAAADEGKINESLSVYTDLNGEAPLEYPVLGTVGN